MMKHIIVLSIIAMLLFTCTDCKKDGGNIITPPDTTKPPVVDTTSHNFTWTQYTFGGTGGSSYFKDVAIVNDSDIWAVGAIFTSPDTMYNAAHWDGSKWELMRITYNYQGQQFFSPLQAIFAFSTNDIWVGSTQPMHWNGIKWEQYDITPETFNGYINKIWGNSSHNLHIVGTNGSIARYVNGNWTKQESRTTIDLRDVWGTPDGKVVWACGWSSDDSKSILLQYDGNNWKRIWERNGGLSTPPFGYYTTSVWGDTSLFLSAGRAAYHITKNETTKVATLPQFPYQIRGSKENDIVVIGDGGMIWHYNGASWKEVNLHSNQTLYSTAISGNLIVAAGIDYNIGFGAALIYVGRRQ